MDFTTKYVEYVEAPSYQPWVTPAVNCASGGPGLLPALTVLDGDAVDGKLVSRLASSYAKALEDCEGVARQRCHVSVGVAWVSLGPGVLNHIKPLGY